MTEPGTPPTLDELDARLKAARAARGEGADGSKGVLDEVPRSPMGLAFRIGVELVSALAVGTGIGYGLDLWLGTGPWLMVLFFFLGSAAGVLNVWRAVNGMGLAVGYKPPRSGDGTGRDMDDGRGGERGGR
jgi:ATP synthase protein I